MNMNNKEKIEKGAFLIARKLFDSEIWLEKPASWSKIWIYILGKVNHKPRGSFDRGEGYFNFTKELLLIGNDITNDMVKHFLQFARKAAMISTKRSTRGTRLKVLKYNNYQALSVYKSTNQNAIATPQQHDSRTTIHKNERIKEFNNIYIFENDQKAFNDIRNKTVRAYWNDGEQDVRVVAVGETLKLWRGHNAEMLEYAGALNDLKYIIN